MLSSNPLNWFLFCFFFVGALGGIVYFVRLMFSYEKRVEVHHRYMQVPVFYGPDAQSELRGRPGDMAQNDSEPISVS